VFFQEKIVFGFECSLGALPVHGRRHALVFSWYFDFVLPNKEFIHASKCMDHRVLDLSYGQRCYQIGDWFLLFREQRQLPSSGKLFFHIEHLVSHRCDMGRINHGALQKRCRHFGLNNIFLVLWS
jgi:hypothetical protein